MVDAHQLIWLDEAERCPDLRVLALHGAGRRRDFARIDEHDLGADPGVALLPRDAAELGKRRFHSLILDEAQMLRTPHCKLPPPSELAHGTPGA